VRENFSFRENCSETYKEKKAPNHPHYALQEELPQRGQEKIHQFGREEEFKL